MTGDPARAPASSPAPSAQLLTLVRFAELWAGLPGVPETLDKEQARAIVRELKAVGCDLRALRVALTGSERGPALWAVLVELGRDESLARAGEAATRA